MDSYNFKEFVINFPSSKLPKNLEPLENESKREYGRRFITDMKDYLTPKTYINGELLRKFKNDSKKYMTTGELYSDGELIGLAYYNYDRQKFIKGGARKSGSPRKDSSKLETMTIPEILKLCRQRGIKNYSNLKKAELVVHVKRFLQRPSSRM